MKDNIMHKINQICNQILKQIRGQVGDQVFSQVYNFMDEEVGDNIDGHIWIQVVDSIEENFQFYIKNEKQH